MKIDRFDLEEKVLVVAEVGNNHEGSYSLAEELIGLAKDAGADAVKFQTFVPELFVSSKDSARLERLRKFQLSFEQFSQLANLARKSGILFFSTPLDMESAKFLDGIQSIFKISSGDNNFIPLLDLVAGFGKPVIFSAGLAEMGEVRFSKELIERRWRMQGNTTAEVAVLHCVSSYPVPPQDASLDNIRKLKAELQCTVGYSDHCNGIDAAVGSVFAGARILEKHFTINKNHSDFRDHQLSADPAEMKVLVEKVRNAELLLGTRTGEKALQASERDNALALRRSIVAKRSLKKDEVLEWEDIIWKRPGNGLAPGEEWKVVGRRLKENVAEGDVILESHVKG